MSACPDEFELVRFLDGEMGALDDARIVLHVEQCVDCQQRLERLTSGPLATDEAAQPEPTHPDREPDADPPDTAVESRESRPGGAGDCPSMEHGTDAVAIKRLARLVFSTQGSGDAAVSARFDPAGWTTDEMAVNQSSERTDAPIGSVRGPIASHRAPHPAEWPDVPGYDIVGQLGEGGMGVVYKARHLGLNRLVALKMIRGGSHARSDLFSRFRVEAESVARLRHPNIIQIYDIGEAGGLPFVALELLDGGSLDRRLAGDPQPGRLAAGLLITMARAVHVAHEAGIIHRDLKPSNVLYSSDGILKITDFGLAKRIDSDDGRTQSGQIMGSPSYMAPEQARGDSRDVGPAADVYALGAILYEMLTGRPPFKGATAIETVRQVVEDEPVTPSRLVPRIPRDVETIALKCLHKDPSRRYPSARSLADDLDRYLVGEPIEARRTPAWERAAKWARRRPLTAAAGAFVLVASLAAIAGLFAYQESQLRLNRRHLAFVEGGSRLEREAETARSPEDFEGVRDRIAEFLPQLDGLADRPGIPDLSDRLARQRDELGRRLAGYRSEQAEGRRLQEFRRLYHDAVFRDSRFTNLDLPGDDEATRRATIAALDVYAAPGSGDSWTIGALPSSLDPTDRAEIADHCYELLLVLSRAETTPEMGLRRLDEAARLRSAPTQAYLLRRAACLERAGDRPGAERARRGADGLAIATAFDHYLAGRERYDRRDLIAALRHFDHTLRQQPDHFWAQCLSAFCWVQLGHPEAARAGFNACLRREPGFAWLYILRGVATGVISSGTSAEEGRLRSEAAEADFRQAMDLLDRKPNAELRYVLLVNRGLLRSRRRDWDAAAVDLKAAIALGDARSLASGNLAMVYLAQGRHDEAIGEFSRAIVGRPDWGPLYRGRADVVLASKDPSAATRAQALADLERAIGMERPDNPVLARDHTNRARLLTLAGRIDEAVAACDAAIERVGDHEDAHRLRLDLLLKKKQHDDVIRSCDPLIARGKASAAIYERRALAREQIRDFPGAIEDFTSAMAMDGDRPRLLRRRGWLYIIADAPRLALHDFQESIRLDPEVGDAFVGRASARLRGGAHRVAIADAEQGLALAGATPELLHRAARVYALAAIVASAEARKTGQEAVLLVNRYRDRAADLLGEAIRRLPANRRAGFVKDVLLVDPDLKTLHRRVSSMAMAGPPPTPAAAAAGAAPGH